MDFGFRNHSVIEGNTAYLTVSFKDEDGNPATPSKIEYTIHDLYTQQEVVSSTPVAPMTSIEITISSSTNDLKGEIVQIEKRVVTITADYADGAVQKDQFIYNVEPLEHFEA